MTPRKKPKHPGDRHSVRAQRMQQQAAAAQQRHQAEAQALQREAETALRADLAHVMHNADWEAFARENNREALIFSAGRVLWIASDAATRCGVPLDHPDMRIMAGAASALGDLAAHPNQINLHRPAVQSGLKAAERLWPGLDVFALGVAGIQFDQMTSSIKGLRLSDFPQLETTP
jgi:hypothetical protein